MPPAESVVIAPDVPAVIDGYVVERELGRGGMATVYEVSLPELNARAALKVPHAGLEESWLEQFRCEAELLFNLSNQHIVKPRAYGRLADGRPYLVMELHRGTTLRSLLDARAVPMPVTEALRYAIQLARGLRAAHAAGIVHRDLKPENIFVDTEEKTTVSAQEVSTLRLADFGLASRVGRKFTHAGSADYLAPEQAAQQPPDGRADLYSLGVVLYEMISGRTPWAREIGLLELLKLQATTDAPRLESVAPGVPAEVAEVVHKLLARNPAQRYQTADAVRDVLETRLKQLENRVERTQVNFDLNAAQRRHATTDLTIAKVQVAVGSRRRWAGLALVLVLVAVGVVLGLGWRATVSQPADLPIKPELVKTPAAVVEPEVAAPAVVEARPEELESLRRPAVATVKPSTKPPTAGCQVDERWRKHALADLDELTQRASKRDALISWATDENEAISQAIASLASGADCGSVDQRLKKFDARVNQQERN